MLDDPSSCASLLNVSSKPNEKGVNLSKNVTVLAFCIVSSLSDLVECDPEGITLLIIPQDWKNAMVLTEVKSSDGTTEVSFYLYCT